MKTYRCKHSIEAMRWMDTNPNREAFAVWFDKHDAMFETRGSEVVLPEEGVVTEGEWILFSDGEFLVMDAEDFADTYEEIPETAQALKQACDPPDACANDGRCWAHSTWDDDVR